MGFILQWQRSREKLGTPSFTFWFSKAKLKSRKCASYSIENKIAISVTQVLIKIMTQMKSVFLTLPKLPLCPLTTTRTFTWHLPKVPTAATLPDLISLGSASSRIISYSVFLTMLRPPPSNPFLHKLFPYQSVFS